MFSTSMDLTYVSIFSTDILRLREDGHHSSERLERLAARVEHWVILRDQYFKPVLEAARAPVLDLPESFTAEGTVDAESRAALIITVDDGAVALGKRKREPSVERVPKVAIGSILIDLPSNYTERVRNESVMKEAVEIERELRKGQANDALDDVRTLLITKFNVLHERKYKSKGIKGSTRSQALLNNHQKVLNRGTAKYRRLRVILLALGLNEDDPTFKELKADDIKPFPVDFKYVEQELGGSKKKNNPSWIWGDFGMMLEREKDGKLKEYFEDRE